MLSDEQYEAAREVAASTYQRHMSSARGQMVTHADSFEWHLARAVAEAAVKDAVGGDEPVAWEFQHEDTGLTMYECPQQVEWGFEKNNPRWKKIGPVYRRPQASQLNLDYLREMGRLEARIRELEQASSAVPEEAHRVIKLLVQCARMAFFALDDSEERVGDDGREHVVDANNFDALCSALDTLEELPDHDDETVILTGPLKAEYLLRKLLAASQPDAKS